MNSLALVGICALMYICSACFWKENTKMNQELQDRIREAAKVLKDEGAEEVYVFGSAAKGTLRDNSDLVQASKTGFGTRRAGFAIPVFRMVLLYLSAGCRENGHSGFLCTQSKHARAFYFQNAGRIE